ncbi:MAG: PorT family protein [Bacteroidota bacterium]|nr:PorT family protein [Bacteroidota bacterium]
MKRFIILCVSILTVTTGVAQIIQIHVGATTTMNATYVLDKGLSEDPRYSSQATYQWAPIGLNFGVDFGRKFGLSLEGIKSKQGQIYDMIDKFEEVKGQRKIALDYLQMPMMFRFMSGGSAGTRANFNLGPQLSFLTGARETITAGAGQYTIPEGLSFESIQTEFPNAVNNNDGTYTLPADVPSKDLLTKKANDFKNTEFSIAGAFGLDIDLSKHLYLTTQVRATYSLTDMRNGDVIDAIKNGDGGSIFSQRANLLVGVQLGLHYMFGSTRSHKFKD